MVAVVFFVLAAFHRAMKDVTAPRNPPPKARAPPPPLPPRGVRNRTYHNVASGGGADGNNGRFRGELA